MQVKILTVIRTKHASEHFPEYVITFRSSAGAFSLVLKKDYPIDSTEPMDEREYNAFIIEANVIETMLQDCVERKTETISHTCTIDYFKFF